MPMLYCGETGGQTCCSLLVDLDGVTSPIRHVQCCAEACILSVGEDRLLPPPLFHPRLGEESPLARASTKSCLVLDSYSAVSHVRRTSSSNVRLENQVDFPTCTPELTLLQLG